MSSGKHSLRYHRTMPVRAIENIDQLKTLIGKDVEVTRAPNVPNAHQLMVGDNSRVQIRS